MQPWTSYWPATSSPVSSCGENENSAPQSGQTPSLSPGRPALPRPTGRPQPLHSRFDSATTGLVRIALAGSMSSLIGISTRPSPMRRTPFRIRGRVGSTLLGADSVTRTARVPSSPAMSIPIVRFWWTRCRPQHREPLLVKRPPRPVDSDAFQAGIDCANQVVLCLVDADPVRLGLQTWSDDVQVRILYSQSGEDRVVGAGRVRLPLLQGHQAVVPILNGQQGCRRRDPRYGGQRRGVHLSANPLAGQVGRPLYIRILRHQQSLARFEVHGGERDLLGTRAGDGHRVDHDVNRLVLQRSDALRRGQQPELHFAGITDQVPGYLPCDVDVEALQLAGHGIAKAEQIGALVETNYQPAALPDRRLGRAGLGGRAQARPGIAAVHGRTGRRGHLRGAAWHRQRGKRRGHLHEWLHTGTPRDQGCREHDQCGAHQWYSLSRGVTPAATASAPNTPMAAAPAGSMFSAV